MKRYHHVLSPASAGLLIVLGCSGSNPESMGNRHHTLTNGMEVILVENHASPMVSSVVSVKAGSIYEDGTNNGVSHLLEHLLFDGTGERTRIEIMEGIEDHGGYLNATTRDDHTAYILLIPSEHMEFGLAVQTDMLFNSIFPDSELVKERKVVIEEINKDSDNPDYVAEKFHRSHLYQGTPFARPVIGYKNIIASISREEVLRYYRERYVPESMVAFITGDFETEEMLAVLERIFGAVPPGGSPGRSEEVQLPRRSNRVYRLKDQAEVSTVSISFDVPEPSDGDYYSFDYFTRLVNYHDGAPLPASLKSGPDPLAFDVRTDLSPHKGFSTLTITTTTKPGKEDAVLEAILKVLEEESAREPKAVDMEGVMVDLKSEEYFLRERYHYYGLMKAPFLVSAGFDFLDTYVERMERVTPSMVQKAAEKYFSRPRYVATAVGPSEGLESGVKVSAVEGTTVKRVLENGLRLIIKEETGSEIFAVHVLAGNRVFLEPSGKSGLADYLSRMLMRGTESRGREKLAGDLAAIGASVTVVDDPYIPYDDYYTSPDYSFVRFETLRDRWKEGLDILGEMIRKPAIDPQEIEGVRQELLGVVSQRGESTYKTAQLLFSRTLFSGHPFSSPIMGTKESLESIGVADLRWLHQTLYAPNNLVIGVVSGVPTDSVTAAFSERFADMVSVELPAGIEAISPISPGIRTGEEKMGKEQAYIEMGDLLPGIESEDVPALRVLMAILSERLALQLREKEGLAYSVGISPHFSRGFGWYEISMGTERPNYPKAVSGIRREIDRIRSEQVSEEEIRKQINRFVGRALIRQLSSINRAYSLSLYEYLCNDFRESDAALARLKEVTAEDVSRVSKEYLRPDRCVLVSVQ